MAHAPNSNPVEPCLRARHRTAPMGSAKFYLPLPCLPRRCAVKAVQEASSAEVRWLGGGGRTPHRPPTHSGLHPPGDPLACSWYQGGVGVGGAAQQPSWHSPEILVKPPSRRLQPLGAEGHLRHMLLAPVVVLCNPPCCLPPPPRKTKKTMAALTSRPHWYPPCRLPYPLPLAISALRPLPLGLQVVPRGMPLPSPPRRPPPHHPP